MSKSNAGAPLVRLPIRLIHIENLFVDKKYQRDYDERHVNIITNQHNVHLFPPLEVSERAPTSFAVIDGGNRLEAARRLGYTHLECRVHNGLSLKDEANLFKQFASRRLKINPYDQYKAAICAGEEVALKVRDIVKGFGYTIAKREGMNVIHHIPCLFLLYRRDVLADVLAVRRAVWGPVPIPAGAMEGLGNLLSVYGDMLDMKRLHTILGRVAPSKVQSEFLDGLHVGGGEVGKYVALGMLAAYNITFSTRQVDKQLSAETLKANFPTRYKRKDEHTVHVTSTVEVRAGA